MITFTAPLTSAYYSVDTDYTVDINPVNNYSVDRFEVTYNGILRQARANGINSVSNSLSFNIVNLLETEGIKLLGYFSELGGVTPLAIAFPEGVINFTLVSWTVNIPKGKFLSISVNAEVAYL